MTEHRRALVTGVTGQDGAILARQLLDAGYEVRGLVRRRSDAGLGNATPLLDEGLRVVQGDVTDAWSIRRAVIAANPDEVYHLAALSHVGRSFNEPQAVFDVNATGTLNVLEAARAAGPPGPRVYVAGTAEQYGLSPPPHTADGPWAPASPYAASKCAAAHMARVYRGAYGMHVSVGFAGNHEGETRGIEFLTRKVAAHVARLARGETPTPLVLGNGDVLKDWGYAPEYCDAMRRMLDQPAPRDYVVCTGELHTVREWVEACFKEAGVAQEGQVTFNNLSMTRPLETVPFHGDTEPARRDLGWAARTRFRDLVRIMVQAELRRDLTVKES